jgi:hypothetical protein
MAEPWLSTVETLTEVFTAAQIGPAGAFEQKPTVSKLIMGKKIRARDSGVHAQMATVTQTSGRGALCTHCR